ncbi:retrovirus-related Pol polyprotein from type-1 retrotransposable element R2 [Trichonephila clavipes]|nr:retrovirus-related Pol polyprotein from type-1 retrotransposable element R2 [Trichonephila clavipes]
MIATTAHELEALCLRLNPSKCATLHISGQNPTGTRPTKFKLGDIEIQALDDGTPYAYLGNPVGFFIQKHFKTANDALSILERLSASNLAQWQKLDALKTFFFPTLSFSMRPGQLGKEDWDEVDVAARREIKDIFSLPPNASTHYIYGNRKLGGCGLPSAAEDSDFYLVDSAFKLLTSKDESVKLEALGQLTRTVAFRIKRTPTDGDLAGFLSGSMEGEYSDTTNQYANHWTLARKASVRQNVSWSFVDGSPSVTIGVEVLTRTKRRGIMRAFHDNFQLIQTQKLLAAPNQGKVMDCVAMAPASTHFLTDGKYTRIRAAVAFKGTILSENQVVGPNRLRPDLVANVDNKIYIIDVTIPFENRRQAFGQARERKVHKYLELIPYFSSLGFRHIQIVPIVVGALGAWDPENDAFLRKVATRSGSAPSVGNDAVQVNERTDSIPPVVTPSTDTPQSNASLPTNVVTPSGSENPNHIPKVPTQKTESPRATTSNDPLAGTVNSVNQSPENSPVSGPCEHENETTKTQSTPSPVVAACDVTQTSETEVAPSVVEG